MTIEFGGKEDFANLEKTLEQMGENWKFYYDAMIAFDIKDYHRTYQIPCEMMRDIMIVNNIEPF